MMYRALIVQPGETPVLANTDTDLPALQDLVGGWIEVLKPIVRDGDWHAYVNEEAALRPGFEPNPLATRLAVDLGWLPSSDRPLLGTVVFVGTGLAGNDFHVPEHVVEAARALGEVFVSESLRDAEGR